MKINLYQKRKDLGMTQYEVARAVGVSVMSYRLWEYGVVQPNAENLKKLKAVLKIS